MNPKSVGHHNPWKQWISALAASSVLLNVNILDIVWMSEREEEVDMLAMGIHTVLVIAGAILGAAFADSFGRKNTLLMTLIFLIPRTFYFVTDAKVSLGLNRFFLDVGSGITCTVVPLYISEIASKTNRGNLMVMQLLAALYGGLAVTITSVITGTRHSYRSDEVMGFSLLAASTSFHAIILGACPETPQYLNWKKMYHEAGRSLMFFRGVKNVVTSGNSIINDSMYREARGPTGKFGGILGAEHRRSLAMIFSLIGIKWASGMRKNALTMNKMLVHEQPLPTIDYPALIFSTMIFIFGIFLMLTVDIFERKLSLLSVILVNFIALAIGMTSLSNYTSVFFGIHWIQYFGHLIIIGATLVYVGKFFPVNVRVTAMALIVSFEVLCRNIFYCIEYMLARSRRTDFCLEYVISSTYIVGFLLILILFPTNIKVPSSDIVTKTPDVISI